MANLGRQAPTHNPKKGGQNNQEPTARPFAHDLLKRWKKTRYMEEGPNQNLLKKSADNRNKDNKRRPTY